MRKKPAGNKASKKQSGSIKQRFFVFSIILFLIIFTGGSIAFVLSMKQVIRDGKRSELIQLADMERITLEASVNAEIAIALKMADSPLIKRYFRNPGDPELERIAFEEIAGYRRAFAGNTVFWVNDFDHKFYSDDAFAFIVDTNDPDNYWYYMTLHETEKYNFNINFNPDLGVTNLWINAPVFDENKKPIGILGTGIDLTAFINSIYRNYTHEADLYFFNDFGEITGAKEMKLVADKVTLDKIFGGIGEEILDWVKNDPAHTLHTFIGNTSEITVGPVPALDWFIAVDLPLSISDYLNTSMTGLFLAMMGLVLLIFVIVNLLIRSSLKPLDGMVSALNQISVDWDLKKRLEIKRKDEIGNLAEFFNDTFEKFRELIYGIKGITFSLTDTGEELSANMD
ncbi:MAG: methyl-accepting chemotaxis protein, partial [Treponema sp.]|nr:methyl-accepting chemotaxis protein [Treponema sp.]